MNYVLIIEMAKGGYASGMPTNLLTLPTVCEHCILGKQTKKSVPKKWEGERSKGLLDIVYSDLTGPEDMTSAGGAKYILNFVEDHSDMLWIYLLKDKNDAPDAFKGWKALVEAETGHNIKCYQNNSGGEFTSSTFEKYLQEAGIKHQTTAPYTSAQNGHAEQMHRTIMDRSWAIHLSASLPPNLWGECALMSAYIKNHTLTCSLKQKTPFKVWYGQKHNVSHMREIGCRAWIKKQTNNPKIYVRSMECTLVSYSLNSKAYCCYEKTTGRIHILRDVTFIELQDAVPQLY
jgi:hypothetical protein